MQLIFPLSISNINTELFCYKLNNGHSGFSIWFMYASLQLKCNLLFVTNLCWSNLSTKSRLSSKSKYILDRCIFLSVNANSCSALRYFVEINFTKFSRTLQIQTPSLQSLSFNHIHYVTTGNQLILFLFHIAFS